MAKDPSPEQIDEICAAIYAGQKIDAIKKYREATGVGLKDAKDFIEALTVRLREESPEKFAAEVAPGSATPGKGCGAVLVVLVHFIAAGVYWLTR